MIPPIMIAAVIAKNMVKVPASHNFELYLISN